MAAIQKTTEAVTISRGTYDGLLETIKRQGEEIEALEYRIKTLSERA